MQRSTGLDVVICQRQLIPKRFTSEGQVLFLRWNAFAVVDGVLQVRDGVCGSKVQCSGAHSQANENTLVILRVIYFAEVSSTSNVRNQARIAVHSDLAEITAEDLVRIRVRMLVTHWTCVCVSCSQGTSDLALITP